MSSALVFPDRAAGSSGPLSVGESGPMVEENSMNEAQRKIFRDRVRVQVNEVRKISSVLRGKHGIISLSVSHIFSGGHDIFGGGKKELFGSS